jgi:hypothetical protein
VKYYAMAKNWEENGPPVYIAVAAYLGMVGKKTKKKAAPVTANIPEDENARNLMALAQEFASSGGIFSG